MKTIGSIKAHVVSLIVIAPLLLGWSPWLQASPVIKGKADLGQTVVENRILFAQADAGSKTQGPGLFQHWWGHDRRCLLYRFSRLCLGIVKKYSRSTGHF